MSASVVYKIPQSYWMWQEKTGRMREGDELRDWEFPPNLTPDQSGSRRVQGPGTTTKKKWVYTRKTQIKCKNLLQCSEYRVRKGRQKAASRCE